MPNPQKRKGSRAELEAARLLIELGHMARRKLGAGRSDDTGDIEIQGRPDVVVQVANWKDALAAVRIKPREVEVQRENAGARHAVTLVRLRSGIWRAVLTPEQLARFLTDSQSRHVQEGVSSD